MDPVELFPYKQSHMRKVFDAFRALLANAMTKAGGYVADADRCPAAVPAVHPSSASPPRFAPITA
jgi:hypothetical protein